MQDIENVISTQNLGTEEIQREPEDVSLELKGPSLASEGVPLNTEGAVQEEASSSPPAQDNAIFSVTTQEGDIIYYENSSIKRIEKVDGIVFSDLLIDEDTGDLIDAKIEYPDGTIQLVEAGKVRNITKPDGTIYNYETKEDLTGYIGEGSDEELVASVVYPNLDDPSIEGTEVIYSYLLDVDGKVLETTLTDPEKTTRYNSSGRLERVEFNNINPENKKIIEYNDGMLEKVTDEDRKVYIYTKTQVETATGMEYVVRLGEIIDAEGNRFLLEDNNIVEIEPAAGMIDIFPLHSYYGAQFLESESYMDNPQATINFNFKNNLNPSRGMVELVARLTDYPNRSVYLTAKAKENGLSVRFQTYSYVTREQEISKEEIPYSFSQDKDYVLKMAWENGVINIYLIPHGEEAIVIYTVDDAEWNPTFGAKSNYMPFSIDPGTTASNISPNNSYTIIGLKSSDRVEGEFSFNHSHQGFSIRFIGYNREEARLSLNGGALSGILDRYVEYQHLPRVPLTLSMNTEYKFKAAFENGVLNIHIEEKVSGESILVYSVEDFAPDEFNLSTFVSGGPLKVQGLRLPPCDFPGDMFSLDGSIIPDYDFTQVPYFNSFRYDDGRRIIEVQNPAYDTTIYEDGLNTCLISVSEISVSTGLPEGMPTFEEINTYIRGLTEGVCTYHPLGRTESRTFSIPDEFGNVYYLYLDEDWNDQGFGRTVKTRRYEPLDNELSHEYSYYPDPEGRLMEKRSYSDADWTNLLVTYNYHNNADNRIHTKTLQSPDENGNIYYRYKNESFDHDQNGIIDPDENYGRTAWSRRQNAIDEELSHYYSYYDGTSRLYSKKAYSNADWTNLTATYIYYYNDDNRMYTKTLPPEPNSPPLGWDFWFRDDGDALIEKDSTYKKSGSYSVKITRNGDINRFKQEIHPGPKPFYWFGKTVMLSCWVKASEANQARLYISDGLHGVASAYHSGSGEWELLTVTHTANGPHGLVWAYLDVRNVDGSVYFDDAILVDVTEGEQLLDNGDFEMWPGSTIYEYKDEDWNGNGYGRLEVETKPDQHYLTYEDYYVDTNQARFIREFDTDDNLLVWWEYDNESNLLSRRKYFVDGSYFEYSGDEMQSFIGPVYSPITQLAIQDLASFLGLEEENIYMSMVEKVEWPDSNLGWPSNNTPSPSPTPGYRIFLVANIQLDDERWTIDCLEYHTDLGTRIIRDPSREGESTIEYISDEFYVQRFENGKIETYKQYGAIDLINTLLDASGTFTTYDYDDTGNLTGYTITYTSGEIGIYDSYGKLLETTIPENNFIKGVNLPWINYGYDLGAKTSFNFHIGYSSDLETLYERLDTRKGDYVRLFLFCDLRLGINFDTTGSPTDFMDKVYEDMRALLNAAKDLNIKLLPTLFDYGIADGVTHEGHYQVGEHAELISEWRKKQALLGLFNEFFEEFASNTSIYAWDIINEPEYATAVSISDMQGFVADFANLIHSKAPDATVTVGSRDRNDLVRYWTDVGLDLYQYHYYDRFEGEIQLDFPAEQLELDKPVLAGELEPTSIEDKLNTLNGNSYAGGLFWEDQGDFTIDEQQYNVLKKWFSGIKITYEYYPSGRKHQEILSNGTVREFENATVYANGNGRIITETYADGSYKTYTYHGETTSRAYVRFFLSDGTSAGTLYIEEEYDTSDNLRAINEYYQSGQPKEIRHSNGLWKVYDEDGTLTEEAKNIDGKIAVFDNTAILIREISQDGTIYEYSELSRTNPIRVINSGASSVEYYYDVDGSVLNRREYSLNGNVSIFDKDNNLIYEYIYDPAVIDDNPTNTLSVTTAMGDVIYYLDNEIIAIKCAEDNTLITDIEFDLNGDFKNAHMIRSDGSVDVVYNASLLLTILTDGTFVRYRDNRPAVDYSEAIGITRYYYTENENGDITSIKTVNEKATCLYDGNGSPIRFRKSNGDITEYKNGHLENIVTTGCNVYLYEYTDTQPPKSILRTVGGENKSIPREIHYTNETGTVDTIFLSGNTKLNHEEGVLQGILGLTERIDINASGELTFWDGEYRKYYDERGNLERMVTEDNTSVYFRGEDISMVESEGGSWMLYEGEYISELYDQKEGVHYETEPDPSAPGKKRIKNATHDNGKVFNYEYENLSDGRLKVTIEEEPDPDAQGSASSVTIRYYVGEYLTEQENALGVVSIYSYESDPNNQSKKRLTTIVQTKNGKEIGRHTYEYFQDKTVVTDIDGIRREYDLKGKIKFMYEPTSNGELVYDYHLTEYNTLVKELIRHHRTDENRIIHYRGGKIDYVESVDEEKTLLTDPVFDEDGMLKSFTVVLPDGKTRRCTLYDDDWTEIVPEEGVKLLYRGDVLVAINAEHRLLMFQEDEMIPSSIPLDITKDPQALNYIYELDGEQSNFMRQKVYHRLVEEHNIEFEEKVGFNTISGGNTWKPQTDSSTTLGITGVAPLGNAIRLTADINSGSTSKFQGEAFLDLFYDSSNAGALQNFEGKQLSYYVKLEEGTLAEGERLDVQVYAKNDHNDGTPQWESEYSTVVTITEDNVWYRVDLIVSDDRPLFGGIKNNGFSPTQIRLVGIRIKTPYDTYDKHFEDVQYNGHIYVKDANYTTLPDDEKLKLDMPLLVDKRLVEPLIGAIADDAPVGGSPYYIGWDSLDSILNNNEAPDNGVINLNRGLWRRQTYEDSQGITDIQPDSANNQWEVTTDLIAGDKNKNAGEMFVDLAYDIPDYKWTGPLNLEGKMLTFQIKAPEDFRASTDKPMWAQIFVKSEGGFNFQYGKHVQIENDEEWYTVTITPQFGEIEEGDSLTSRGFDPTSIYSLGLKISCNENSIGQYQGLIYVRNLTPTSVFEENTTVRMLDIRALRLYAVRRNLILGFEEFLGSQVNMAKTKLPTYYKGDNYAMATEYYENGAIRSVLKGSNRAEYYDMKGNLIRVTDEYDMSIAEYKYDANGDLIDIDYSGMRERTRQSMESARIRSEQETLKAILEIAQALEDATAYVDYATLPAFSQLYSKRGRAEREKNEWENKDVPWYDSKKRAKKERIIRTEQAKIDAINVAINDLLNQIKDTNDNLSQEAQDAIDDVNAELETRLTQIDEHEEETLELTLEQEVLEITNVYYRKTLGRSLSGAEITYWIEDVARPNGCLDINNKVAFDVSLVKVKLETDQAYIDEAQRNDTFIQNVTDGVVGYLDSFKELQQSDKDTTLQNDFLLEDTDILYDEDDFDVIISWLKSNNKHFAKSAFLPLKDIFENNGLTYDLEDAAIKAILIEIFTGSIDSLMSQELEISTFALTKYAKIKENLELYSVELDKTSLEALRYVIENDNHAILRVENHHFITVTSIDADGKVEYFEPSRGELGELMEMDGDRLLEIWDGFGISQRGPPTDDGTSRFLTALEARAIRGSEPLSLIAILAIISIAAGIVSIGLSLIDNEIAQMLSNVFAIISAITGIASIVMSFPNILANFAKGLTEAGKAISGGFKFLGQIFKEGLKGFVSALSTFVGRAISSVVLFQSYHKTLTVFGVDSDISDITAAFLSGGFVSPYTPFSITGGMSSLVFGGIRYIGKELKIDPIVTNIIGISAATIVTAGIGGIDKVLPGGAVEHLTGLEAISHTIETTLLANVAGELAYYGITELGEAIGIDSRISYLAGIGIRSSLQMGFSAGGGDPGAFAKGLFQGAIKGVFQGGTNLALNLIGQTFNIDPLYLSLGARAITGAISGALSKESDMFKGIGEAFKSSTLNLLTFGMYDPETGTYRTDPWSQAGYISQVLDFSQKVQEEGLLPALEIYTAAIFQQETVNAILSEGGIIDLIFRRINEGKVENVIYNGIQAKKVKMQEGDKEVYLIYSATEDKLLAIRDGNRLLETTDGQYELGPDGDFGIKDGTITTYYDDGMMIVQDITNREQSGIDIYLPNDDGTINMTGWDSIGPIEYDEYGFLKDAKISSDEFEVYLREGNIEGYETQLFGEADISGRLLIESAGITDYDLEGARLVLERQVDGTYSTSIDAPTLTYEDAYGQEITRYLGLEFPSDGTSNFIINMSNLIKEQSNKLLNYFTGFGVRTDDEIAIQKAVKVQLGRDYCQDGDTIYGSSGIEAGPMDGFIGLSIKAGEVMTDTNDSISTMQLLTNPIGYMASRVADTGFNLFHDNKTTVVNHVGQITTINGVKYVAEQNPGGPKFTLYDDYCNRYKDIEIVRANPELMADEAVNSLVDEYLDRETLTANENAPDYDFIGILGIASRVYGDLTTSICSEFIIRGFSAIGIQLPGIQYNLRISPQELWSNRASWGTDLMQLYPQGE